MDMSKSTALPIRKNPLPLPAALQRRNAPGLTFELLRSRSPQFRTLQAERALVRPGPVKPKIVSSAHGRIRTVLLTYPAYAAGEYSYRSVYIDLIGKLPRTTKFIRRSIRPARLFTLAARFQCRRLKPARSRSTASRGKKRSIPGQVRPSRFSTLICL